MRVYSDQLKQQIKVILQLNDIMAVKVSSGKAYVKGFDIDKAATTILDVENQEIKKS